MNAPTDEETIHAKLQSSLAAAVKSTGEYLDSLKMQLATYGGDVQHSTVDFFASALASASASLEELKASAAKLSSDVSATAKEELVAAQASLAKVGAAFEHLKTQASDYDAKFNAKVADVMHHQRQHVDDGLRYAKERVDALISLVLLAQE
ncbi:Aste57867_11665 [Aphanomyces stellatus]|uniref:Aste57867_11665 protein n=1 Tax=Aphanomyces stellatus TaxID=120398 RepID=A0A485KTM7_9STRA|nr:hypothetical protein As57867_011622 [Aphanomyces stellatus]VFT88523.1 Aste57867_11665 [Aphanomyces stellatus]